MNINRKIGLFVLASAAFLLQACSTLDFAKGNTYVGSVVNNGEPTPIVTHLFSQQPDAQKFVYGSFMYKEGDRWVTGYISHCKSLPKHKLHCYWHDKYGQGLMEVRFNETYTSFEGAWGNSCSVQSDLFWNGMKQ